MSGGLRSGFTTGTCAAAAARAACERLLSGETLSHVSVMTPRGVRADLAVEMMEISETTGEVGRPFASDAAAVTCAVRKDAGDDPDVTDKALIQVSVSFGPPAGENESRAYVYESGSTGCTVYLYGGTGVGLVTKPGLSCPVGKHAINPVPREMIFRQIEDCLRRTAERQPSDWRTRSISVCVSVPEGERLALRTFNRELGVLGGISILGSSGVVEPMSEEALLETIRLEARVKIAEGRRCLAMTPGNYGERFLREELGISLSQAVRVSNFIGDGLEILNREGASEILLVGHIGKLIKVAGGVLNTHSRYGDRRMEILADCVQASGPLERRIRSCNTTEEAVEILREQGCCGPVFQTVVRRIKECLEAQPFSKVPLEVVTFSSVYGILAMTDGAERLIGKIKREQKEG